MLRRLVIGLMDDAARVVLAVPLDTLEFNAAPLATTVGYEDRGSRLARGARTRRLIKKLGDLDPPLGSDDDLLDVVHAWGAGCWPLAAELARATGAALALELTGADLLRKLRAHERRFSPAGSDDEPLRASWIAPNAALHRAAIEHEPNWPVALARWGVHPPDHPRRDRPEGAPASVSILSSGKDPGDLTPLLRGLADLAVDREDLLVFLDAAAVEHHHAVWKTADSLGMLDKLSVVADLETRRELFMQSDVLVYPEARGEPRSIILDAMAAGVVVVARADPYLEVTAVPDIAVLVTDNEPEQWSAALGDVLDHPSRFRAISAAARDRIAADRPVHKHVEALLAAYAHLTDPTPLEFPGPTAERSG